MNTTCSYCNRNFDLRYLTIHTILAHHKHEEPTYSEYKYIQDNSSLYYSVKFLYDDDYINTSYSDEMNKKIIDAIIRNEQIIMIEFIENSVKKQHLINLQTMKIINIGMNCCNCFEPEGIYDLVIFIDKVPVYRSILINNCSDQIYPLRTEYFKHLCILQNR